MNPNVVDFIVIIFLLIILVRGIFTLYFLVQTLKWLEVSISNSKFKVNLNKKVYVLIPVLREQARIIQTLIYMLKIFPERNVRIVVITTQKEYEKKFTGKSTYDLVKDFILLLKLHRKIILLDYPDKSGFMAHQLNFAIDRIEDDSYSMIYNADSRPHPQTMNVFLQLLRQYPNAKIFQQSAVFLKNFDNFTKNNVLKREFLRTSAILQTRWTLTHEIPRLIRQSLSNNKFLINYANAHCVGHGLIINTKLLKEINGFPTDKAVTEDLFLGYIFKALGYKIYPFPLLELADSPISLKGLWNQKYVWFWGVFNYLKYYKFVINKFSNYPLKRIKLIIYLMQGYISSFAWLTSGILVLFSLVIVLWLGNIWLIIFWLVSFIIYGPLQYILIGKKINFLYQKSGDDHPQLKTKELLSIGLISLPVIIFNSLPTYQTILAEVSNNLFGTGINKPKTDE